METALKFRTFVIVIIVLALAAFMIENKDIRDRFTGKAVRARASVQDMHAVTAETQTDAKGLLNAFGYTQFQIGEVNELRSKYSSKPAQYLLQAAREHNKEKKR